METTKIKSVITRALLILLSLLVPVFAKAEKSIRDSISDDETNSLYIIGGVLAFGIGFYVVYSLIEKNKKRQTPANRKPVSHRNHHHHRVLKKSS